MNIRPHIKLTLTESGIAVGPKGDSAYEGYVKSCILQGIEPMSEADYLNAPDKANTAANSANEKALAANTAAQTANTAATNADEKAQAAQTATTEAQAATLAAQETADHPTYVGQDHYVYIWNKDTDSYEKTDIYCKGDAFSIAKTYPSIAAMNADFSGTDTKVGDFVLIETGTVEDPDNSKLYVKTQTVWSYLTDLSGAIGFTGKTPQLSIGTVTTGAAGSSAVVTISDDGVDPSGNPKYKLNFSIPRGDKGEKGDTGNTGKSAYQYYFETTTDNPKLTEEQFATLHAQIPANETSRVTAETARNVASNVYNITLAVPLSAGQYYTSTTARAAVPVGVRKKGLELVYETSAGSWYSERYIGSDVAAWTTATNWERLPMTADFQAFLPAVPFSNRVLADGGSVRNKQALFDSYKSALDLLPNTVLAFSPEIGVKQSVNGLVYKASKLYDMSSLSNDANQTTLGSQPYIGGNITSNERMWLWGTSKQISHSPISFANGEKWSICWISDTAGGGRIYIGTNQGFIDNRNTYIQIGNTTGTNVVIPHLFNTVSRTVRNYLICKGLGEFEYWINGSLIAKGTLADTSIIFQTLYVENRKLKSVRIFNKDLARYEIENLDKFLSSIYPEYDTVAIGTQAWLTSNHLGNVTSDGFVIPDIQPNDSTTNPELISGGNFEGGLIGSFLTEPGGVVASYTLNTVNPISGTQDGRIQVTSVGTSNSRPLLKLGTVGFMQAGKRYKIKFDYKVNSGTCILTYVYDGALLNINKTLSGSGTLEFAVYLSANWELALYFDGRNTFDLQIDNPSAKEAGWADAQLLYDTYIGAGRSSLEATKAASMCCKYSNSDDNAVIYGFIANWWAAYLLSINPPKGLRYPTEFDSDQLRTTLGGSAIAGGKLKKEGLTYWNSPNTGASNESGFTAIGGGVRLPSGGFANLKDEQYHWVMPESSSTLGKYIVIRANSAGLGATATLDKRYGMSIRFLKNSPVGDLFEEIDTGTFTQNIASSQRELAVKFGYSIEVIKVYSSTSLTNIKVEARTTAGVLLATLLPTGSTTAGVPFEFKVTQGMPIQYQDYKLWITATGNSGGGMQVICNTKKSIL